MCIYSQLCQDFVYHFYYCPVRTVGITSTFQHTCISTFQAKRKDIETDIGTCFINNADNPERNTYFLQMQPVRTNGFLQDSAERGRQSCHIPHIGCNSFQTFFRQFQPVVLRVCRIHPLKVLPIGFQYFSTMLHGCICNCKQHLVYLFFVQQCQPAGSLTDIV